MALNILDFVKYDYHDPVESPWGGFKPLKRFLQSSPPPPQQGSVAAAGLNPLIATDKVWRGHWVLAP